MLFIFHLPVEANTLHAFSVTSYTYTSSSTFLSPSSPLLLPTSIPPHVFPTIPLFLHLSIYHLSTMFSSCVQFGYTPLHHAVDKCHCAVVDLLIKRGARVNVVAKVSFEDEPRSSNSVYPVFYATSHSFLSYAT
jgi:ankyrin repeat protein